MLKRFALASTGLLALTCAASAADLPQRAVAPVMPAPVLPAFTWSGFYLGTHSGGVFLDGTINTRGNAANTIANVAANRRPSSISTDESSFFSGVQAGFNAQFGSIVAGVEADISLMDVATRTAFVSTQNDPSFFRQELDYFGTVRGRVGIAFDRVLVYATGGLAYGDVTNRAAFLRNTDGALQFAGQSSNVEIGYAVGGGVEFSIPQELQFFNLIGPLLGASAVTVKAEYLYFDLGDKDVVVNAVPGVGANSYTSNFETKGHIGRIGFNYRFGS